MLDKCFYTNLTPKMFGIELNKCLLTTLKTNYINKHVSDLIGKLEWAANVRFKKLSFDLKSSPIFLQYFFGGDGFGG